MVFNITLGIAYNDYTWQEVICKNIDILEYNNDDSSLSDFCFNYIVNDPSYTQIKKDLVSGYFILHLEPA